MNYLSSIWMSYRHMFCIRWLCFYCDTFSAVYSDCYGFSYGYREHF